MMAGICAPENSPKALRRRARGARRWRARRQRSERGGHEQEGGVWRAGCGRQRRAGHLLVLVRRRRRRRRPTRGCRHDLGEQAVPRRGPTLTTRGSAGVLYLQPEGRGPLLRLSLAARIVAERRPRCRSSSRACTGMTSSERSHCAYLQLTLNVCCSGARVRMCSASKSSPTRTCARRSSPSAARPSSIPA
jgi:hypothetical protein